VAGSPSRTARSTSAGCADQPVRRRRCRAAAASKAFAGSGCQASAGESASLGAADVETGAVAGVTELVSMAVKTPGCRAGFTRTKERTRQELVFLEPDPVAGGGGCGTRRRSTAVIMFVEGDGIQLVAAAGDVDVARSEGRSRLRVARLRSRWPGTKLQRVMQSIPKSRRSTPELKGLRRTISY
jgi:hypothetical protein